MGSLCCFTFYFAARAMSSLFASTAASFLGERLKVTGVIPRWLRGSFLRVGPAQFEVGQQTYRHWFDGLAAVFSFKIDDDGVTFGAEMLNSETYKTNMEEQRIAVMEFGTPALPDPCKNIFSRFFTYFQPPRFTDNTNVSLVSVYDKVLAATETPLLWEVDTQSLKAVKRIDVREHLSCHTTTAHPCESRGTIYNVATKFGRNCEYKVYSLNGVADTSGDTTIATVSAGRYPSYMHSFGLTGTHTVIIETPLKLRPLSLITSRFRGESYMDCLTWEPDIPTKFIIISNSDGQVVSTPETAPFFMFHTINAFEQPSVVGKRKITVDCAVYPDATVVKSFYLQELRSRTEEGTPKPLPLPKLRRFHLVEADDGKWNVDVDATIDAVIELPRINPAYQQKQYNYVYGLALTESSVFLDRLVKVDLSSGRQDTWHEEGWYPSEPVFIASPEATTEDDGVVLSLAINPTKGLSKLLVCDGKTFTVVAEAEVPRQLAYGFHGLFKPTTNADG